MTVAYSINDMLARKSASVNFPPISSVDNGIIYLEDTRRKSYLGTCMIGQSAIGAGNEVVEGLKSSLIQNYPDGTIAQIYQISVSDIEGQVGSYVASKVPSIISSPIIPDHQRDVLWNAIKMRADFFREGLETPHIGSTNLKNHRVIQAICLKIPCSNNPGAEELKSVTDMLEKFEAAISSIGLILRRANEGQYLSLLRFSFNPFSSDDPHYDPDLQIRDQVLPPGFAVRTNEGDYKTLQLDESYVKILSPKRLPRHASLGMMNYVVGDPSGLTNQIGMPWISCLTIHLPDPGKKKTAFRAKHQLINQQATGQLARWSQRILAKKQNFDALAKEIDQGGEQLVEMTFSMALFNKDRRELGRGASAVGTYLSSLGYEMVQDSDILWPLFWNMMPLFPSPASMMNLSRSRTMTMSQALQFSPLLSEWSGTGDGAAMLLETRRGIPFQYDLYHSDTNYNGLIFAESGAGKSFFTQYLVTDYLAQGAKIWVVDIGLSYYKLSKTLGGEFIRFNEGSNICMNPFTNVTDVDEEMDLLKALLAKMASPVGALDDYRMARLEEAIKAVWGRYGKAMTVSEIADYMQSQSDERVVDIGKQLFPFTRNGQYGIWFDGENNLNFNSNFIVLELEDLQGKKHLQQVVLMILMAKIQHEMFLSSMKGEKIKKISIFDESWALFSDPGVARYLQHGFRRFRKYDGAALLVVQSLMDFYAHPEMEPIVQNAANKIILKQTPESVDMVVDQKKLPLDEYGRIQLKSVHSVPGSYSEIMFMRGQAWSIARLVLPRYHQVLFSTKGEERDGLIKMIEDGVPPDEAIRAYM